MNKVIAQAWNDYNSNIVSINEDALMNLKISDEDKAILASHEMDALAGKDMKESVRFLIGLNSINYQFWDVQDGVFVRYENRGKVGALGSFEGYVALHNMLEANNFDTSLINNTTMQECFGNIPDKERRIDILREALDKENFDKVYKTIEQHVQNKKIDVQTAEDIASLMPISYNDPYLKKIQLALYEIGQIYVHHGKDLNIDITVAADYQIPKVLEGMGVLKYSPELSKKIDNFGIIEENSVEEKALRAATIISCEQISHEHGISIPALDRVLWLARNNFKDKKFHLTKTSNY